MTGRSARCSPARGGRPWQALLLVAAALAGPLMLARARPANAARAPAGDRGLTGSWVSTSGPERIVFSADGHFRTCIAGGRQGNAALGLWRREAPGRYVVEFTHTAAPDCSRPAQPLRQHRASIVGQVLLSHGELALYVSGEFPPDIYRPLAPGR